jgi:hydroxymethylpyrimidine/phosphomethylpyrimidine kinase
MLYSAPIIRAVAGFFRNRKRPPLVVDPVIVATSGACLLLPAALKTLRNDLLPLAALVMPNVAEAELLLGTKLHSVEDLRFAARELRKQFGCAALVKGGHLHRLSEATDVFYDGKRELLLSAPFVRGVKTHGTGCTYSAAVTGYLATGIPLLKAVQKAKKFITQAIAQSQHVGGHTALNWLHRAG